MVADAWWMGLVGALLIVAAPAVALAWALRRSMVPGGARAAGIVAGIFVGLIVGPGVLGRARPGEFAAVFEGGTARMEELKALDARQAMDRAALVAAGASGAALEEIGEDQSKARAPIEKELAKERADRRGLFDMTLAVVAGLLLMGSAGAMVPSRGRGIARLARELVETSGAPARVGILSLALGAALPACVALMFLPARAAIGFALVLAIPGVSLAQRGPMMMACAIAGGISGTAALILGWSAPATVMVAGLVGGLLIALGLEGRRARRVRRVGLRMANGVMLPALSGLLAARVDVVTLGSAPATASIFWFALVASLLWSSDGRMLAMWASCRLAGWNGGRSWVAAARGVSAGAGVMQIVLVAALAQGGLAPEAIIAAALAGGALVEVSQGARAWLARAMDGTMKR